MLTRSQTANDAAAAAVIDGDEAVAATGAVAARGFLEQHTDDVAGDDGSVRAVTRTEYRSASRLAQGEVYEINGQRWEVTSATNEGHLWLHRLRLSAAE